MNSGIPGLFISALLAVTLTLLSIKKVRAVPAPFLFFCQQGAPDLHTQVNVQLSGNPKFYESGQIYNVSVELAEEFDVFLVTGVYSGGGFLNEHLSSVFPRQKMCSVLHSSGGLHGWRRSVSFAWIGPPHKIGCVDFIGTFTRGENILAQDALIYQICPPEKKHLKTNLSALYEEGVIFREDFESGQLSPSLWKHYSEGVMVSDSCEPVFSGLSGLFCATTALKNLPANTVRYHEIVTVPLDVSTAGALQFTLGRTLCSQLSLSQHLSDNVFNAYSINIEYAYSSSSCSNWVFLRNVSLPTDKQVAMNVISLPLNVREDDVCFRWTTPVIDDVCLAIDNIIITDVAKRPSSLHINLDAFNPTDWIFFPGGFVQSKCKESTNSMVFNASYEYLNSATTRDIQSLLPNTAANQMIWRPDLNSSATLQSTWEWVNVSTGDSCSSQNIVILHPDEKISACSPLLDLTGAANLRFRLKPWYPASECQQSQDVKTESKQNVKETSREKQELSINKLSVWVAHNTKRYTISQGLNPADNLGLLSLTIPVEARAVQRRICWQLSPETFASSVPNQSWTLEDVSLLPVLPSPVEWVLQFRLQTHCTHPSGMIDETGSAYNILVQYSNDEGRRWSNLYQLCLPPSCNGIHLAIQTSWFSNEVVPWERITLPLPFASLTDTLRIRFIQKGYSQDETWALDDIHLGSCPSGCSGHGTCNKSCICDTGYFGQDCSITNVGLSTSIHENFESRSDFQNRFFKSSGFQFGTSCGRVTSGQSAIFNQVGNRQLVTLDLNTTLSQTITFVVRMNNPTRDEQHCPGPDRPVESVYVHSSCNGGITWSLVTFIQPLTTGGSKLVRAPLNLESRASSCRFRIWQPYHSGKGRDVWSIDDLYIGPEMYDSISFGELAWDTSIFIGNPLKSSFCNKSGVIIIQPNVTEQVILETYPVRVGFSAMIQLQLVFGCQQPDEYTASDYSIAVSFSTDGGISWTELRHVEQLWLHHISKFHKWKRISLKLPTQSWSDSTRFRITWKGSLSLGSSSPMKGGLAYFYVGPECPDACRGNGRCSLSGCVCDHGFHQHNCVPESPLRRDSQSLGSVSITGGAITENDMDGCFIRGTWNSLMDSAGVRVLEIKEFEYLPESSVQFFLRLGECGVDDSSEEAHTSVHLQASWNGGTKWILIREFRTPFFSVPHFQRIPIPPPEPGVFRNYLKIRIIQTGMKTWLPETQRRDRNIWSVAGLSIWDPSMTLRKSDIHQLDHAQLEKNEELWLVKNVADPGVSCHLFDINCQRRIQWYGAMTKDIILEQNDSIQFGVVTSAPTSGLNVWVALEYSVDGGAVWDWVQRKCVHPWMNCGEIRQPSMMNYEVLSDQEERYHYHVTEDMANRSIILRWLYYSPKQRQELVGFRIQNLHIGNSCPSLCSGHGNCWKGICSCDSGYFGSDCSEGYENKPSGLLDTFTDWEDNNSQHFSYLWQRIIGGRRLPNFCDLRRNPPNYVMFFGDIGPRYAITTQINTQNMRVVKFTLGFTSEQVNKKTCKSNKAPQGSGVVVFDYSNNNGLTWKYIRSITFDPVAAKNKVVVALPSDGHGAATSFRWWQVDDPKSMKNLHWYLDDVIFNINETNPVVFEYEGGHRMGRQRNTHNSNAFDRTWASHRAIVFSWQGFQGVTTPEQYQLGALMNEGSKSVPFAETWDMDINVSTFVQFQIFIINYQVNKLIIRFEYSLDHGRRWRLVLPECFNNTEELQERQCEYLSPSSRYYLTAKTNATRITVRLPPETISRSTRFRWISESSPDLIEETNWVIGHVYIGENCPWMCSGHGTCHQGHCNCDRSFGGQDCVTMEPHSSSLAVHFDKGTEAILSGGSFSNACGVLQSGTAAVFHEDGLRFFESPDLDLTSISYVQFTVKFHCWGEHELLLQENLLLFQYSVNGGITWSLMQEIEPMKQVQHQIVDMTRISGLTNSTRLRIWQPLHSGKGLDSWAIDSFVVHSPAYLEVPFFKKEFHPDDLQENNLLISFGGKSKSFCSRDNVVAFTGELGDNLITTRDFFISTDAIIQFDINVGCNSSPSLHFPVRLEYSVNGGSDWKLVSPDPYRRNVNEKMPTQTSSVYYSSTSGRWRRETLRLSHLETHRSVQIRWNQGYLNENDRSSAPHWALQNIFIGHCYELCNGHGSCTQDGTCSCDNGYYGYACELLEHSNPSEFHETFDENSVVDSHWTLISGGKLSSLSQRLGIGNSLLFGEKGIRRLETCDLDLTNANFIQFSIDFIGNNGLDFVPWKEVAVILEYSSNGGVDWTIFHMLKSLDRTGINQIYQVPIPVMAMRLSTRLRWSQTTVGNIHLKWKIDEIYIGSSVGKKTSLIEDFSSNKSLKNNWLLVVGGVLQSSCNSNSSSLYFPYGDYQSKSMAVTKDILLEDNSYMQFQISIGCNSLPSTCSNIELEYSDNLGIVWHRIRDKCSLINEECDTSSLHSGLLSQTTGFISSVTISLAEIKGVVRFRWIDNGGYNHDWSLHWLYIGSQCGGCGGRGRCVSGSCICQPNWKGERCELPIERLLSSVRETFSNQLNPNVWSQVMGGSVSSLCGILNSGRSLHFYDACHRYAETHELDCRHVQVIQFNLRSDCGESGHSGLILFQHSLNGGITWNTSLSLSLNDFVDTKLVSYTVPSSLKVNGIKLRFWQPNLSSEPTTSSWAIDSLIIDSPLQIQSQRLGEMSHETRPPLTEDGKTERANQIETGTLLRWDRIHDLDQRLWWRTININHNTGHG